MAKTAQQLIRELSSRLQEYVLCVPSSGGQTALHCPELVMFFPQQIQQFNGWVYCASDVDAPNKGHERRGQQWTTDGTLSLYAPGFPVAISGGEYEIHMRYPRARIVEALNTAIGQLGLNWYRNWVDETITTEANRWIYPLPAGQNWANVHRLEIQINVSETQIGYPYASAEYLNWRPRNWTDDQGNELWAIEFGLLPPPDRKLRVFGEQYFGDITSDTDVLPVGGKWERAALDWCYDYAEFRLQWWLTNKQPTAEADKLRQQALDRLENQKNEILQNAPSHRPGRIVTPGHGDGLAFPSPEDWRFLGAFKSASFGR